MGEEREIDETALQEKLVQVDQYHYKYYILYTNTMQVRLDSENVQHGQRL